MISDRELDRTISSWLAATQPEAAPARYLQAAFEQIARTPQVRSLGQRAASGFARRRTSRRVALALAAVLVTATTVIAIGALSTAPQPTATPSGTAPAPSSTAGVSNLGQRITFADRGLVVAAPSGWVQAGGACCVPIVLEGVDPTGQLSVYHGPPADATLCDPGCVKLDVPGFLPFDGERTLDAVASEVSARVGTDAWVRSEDMHPRLKDVRRLDVTRVGETTQRQTYVIGSYLNGIVVIVLTLDDRPGVEDLADEILRAIEPFPGAWVVNGKLIDHAEPALGFQVSVPDAWPADARPAADEVRSYGDSQLTISVAPATSMSVCDPNCRTVPADDLDGLERAVMAPPGPGISTGDRQLSGAPARFQRIDGSARPSYRLIATIDGTIVHLWFDLADPNVDFSVVEAIVGSFLFVAPQSLTNVNGVVVGDGFEVVLPDDWAGGWNSASVKLDVSSGNTSNSFWMCRWSGFSSAHIPCFIRQATTLDELVDVTGLGSSSFDAEIDGEPAAVFRVETFEYPAAGPQYLGYILTVHDGRPFVIRVHNRRSGELFLDELLAGFRFTD